MFLPSNVGYIVLIDLVYRNIDQEHQGEIQHAFQRMGIEQEDYHDYSLL